MDGRSCMSVIKRYYEIGRRQTFLLPIYPEILSLNAIPLASPVFTISPSKTRPPASLPPMLNLNQRLVIQFFTLPPISSTPFPHSLPSPFPPPTPAPAPLPISPLPVHSARIPDQYQHMNPQESDWGGCCRHFSKDSWYQLSLLDLPPTKIHPLLRQRVFCWLMEQSSSQKLSRKIFSLACYYFDLYLQKIEANQKDPLQSIAIVCLLLACKLDNHPILHHLAKCLPQKPLFQLEQRVCLRLGFRLHPETYVEILDGLMRQWCLFIRGEGSQLLGVCRQGGQQEQSVHIIRLFQLMDCVNLGNHSNYFSYKFIRIQLRSAGVQPFLPRGLLQGRRGRRSADRGEGRQAVWGESVFGGKGVRGGVRPVYAQGGRGGDDGGIGSGGGDIPGALSGVGEGQGQGRGSLPAERQPHFRGVIQVHHPPQPPPPKMIQMPNPSTTHPIIR